MIQQERLTGLSAKDLEDLFLLTPRILCDYRDPKRGPYNLAYVYAATEDNEDSSFLRAIELAGTIDHLALAEASVPGSGYAGFDHSVRRLQELGWSRRREIIKIDVGENANTGSEAQKLIEHVPDLKPYDIIVIAPPFHIVRAFMTTVTKLKQNNLPFLRVYATPGVPLPWSEEVVHSQGILQARRYALVGTELQRLEKYRAEEYGSLLSAQEVIEYLDWRDAN